MILTDARRFVSGGISFAEFNARHDLSVRAGNVLGSWKPNMPLTVATLQRAAGTRVAKEILTRLAATRLSSANGANGRREDQK